MGKERLYKEWWSPGERRSACKPRVESNSIFFFRALFIIRRRSRESKGTDQTWTRRGAFPMYVLARVGGSRRKFLMPTSEPYVYNLSVNTTLEAHGGG